MQDIQDITGAGCENKFPDCIPWKPVIRFLYSERMQVYTIHINFLYNFLENYAQIRYNQRRFSNVTYTTTSLPRWYGMV